MVVSIRVWLDWLGLKVFLFIAKWKVRTDLDLSARAGQVKGGVAHFRNTDQAYLVATNGTA